MKVFWCIPIMGEPRSFSVATAVDAGLLMITTGIALAVALVFVEVRVVAGVTG
jgi:hypothetical protein